MVVACDQISRPFPSILQACKLGGGESLGTGLCVHQGPFLWCHTLLQSSWYRPGLGTRLLWVGGLVPRLVQAVLPLQVQWLTSLVPRPPSEKFFRGGSGNETSGWPVTKIGYQDNPCCHCQCQSQRRWKYRPQLHTSWFQRNLAVSNNP